MRQREHAEIQGGGLWEGASLVAGTAIGGGMLAIPLYTFEGGIVGASLASLGAWACLTATGLAFCRVWSASPDCACWLSLARRWLGHGCSAAVSMFLLGFLWLLLTAYSAGGANLLGRGLLSSGEANLLFLGPLVAVLAAGRKTTARLNGRLFTLLLLAAGGMALLAGPIWRIDSLVTPPLQISNAWWKALPVLFAAFGFHAVLPTLGRHTGSDIRQMSRCVLLGTTVALVLIVIWQALVFGCLRPDELHQLALLGQPVTGALGERTSGAAMFGLASIIFAYLALATSFLGVAQAGLDVLAPGGGWPKRLPTLAILVGSAWFAARIHPALFGEALSLAGGFGVSLLNGVLPIALILAANRAGKISCSPLERIFWQVTALISLTPLLVELIPWFR